MVLAKFLFIASVLCYQAQANMSPNYPEPGTIWKSGQNYEITWFNDKQAPSMDKAWKKFKIDFMTGDNMNQKFLKNVASNLDARSVKSLNWTAPEVEPHSAVYFLMFTNEKGQSAWTTRFGITGPDGKLVKPEKSVQPDGAKIPWGVGKLVGSAPSATNDTASPASSAVYSMNSAMSSAAKNNAAVVIATSAPTTSAGGSYTPSVLLAVSLLSLSAVGSLFL